MRPAAGGGTRKRWSGFDIALPRRPPPWGDGGEIKNRLGLVRCLPVCAAVLRILKEQGL